MLRETWGHPLLPASTSPVTTDRPLNLPHVEDTLASCECDDDEKAWCPQTTDTGRLLFLPQVAMVRIAQTCL